MSVDFNSMINKALSESQQRRAFGNSAKFLEVDNVSKSTETKSGGELSVEDIANAMKSGRLKKEEDNKIEVKSLQPFEISNTFNVF